MNRITLHLGMPKTGTTSLQKQYFQQWESIRYAGSFGEPTGWDHLRFLNSAEAFDFQIRRDEIRSYFQNLINDENENKSWLVSKEECLIGHQYPANMGFADRSLVVQRLKDVFGTAQVIVVLRNQLTFLPSFFSQWQQHWYVSQHSFGRWLDSQFENEQKHLGSILNIPRYDAVRQILSREFGDENLHFLFYEDFLDEPLTFLQQFANTAGVTNSVNLASASKENTKPGGVSTWLQKTANRNPVLTKLFPKGLKNLAQKAASLRAGKTINPTADEIQKIVDYYRIDNQKFAQATGLDLAKHGYPIA